MTNRVLPLHYIAALMAVCGLLVIERAVYITGSHAGKALLHVTSTLLTLGLGLGLYWRPGAVQAGQGGRTHLWLLLVLRCCSAVLGEWGRWR